MLKKDVGRVRKDGFYETDYVLEIGAQDGWQGFVRFVSRAIQLLLIGKVA